MERTYTTGSTENVSTEQRGREFYLPATSRQSTEPGPVERFLAALFRRRGSYRPVEENDDTPWR